MDRYVILCVAEDVGGEEVSSKIEEAVKNFTRFDHQGGTDGVFTIKNCYLFINGVDISPFEERNQAITFNKTRCKVWSKMNAKCESDLHLELSEEMSFEGGIADQLLEISEYLPKCGSVVEVLFLCNSSSLAVIENLELYGSLKCFASWYNAAITFIDMRDEKSDVSLQWNSLLGADIHNASEIMKVDKENFPLWRGTIELDSNQASSSLTLGGFTLTRNTYTPRPHILVDGPEGAKRQLGILSNTMEYVGEVDLCHTPDYYLTDQLFNLEVRNNSEVFERSRMLLDNLKSNRNLGYMLRIKTGTGWREIENENNFICSDKKERKKWQDYIQEDCTFAEENPVMSELTGTSGHLSLLAYYCQESDKIVAHRLRNPKELNGHVMDKISMTEFKGASRKKKRRRSKSQVNVEDCLMSLPKLSLTVISQNIELLQAKVLEEWIGKNKPVDGPAVIYSTDLSLLLSQTADTYITHLRDSGQLEISVLADTEYTLPDNVYIPEWKRDPYQQPERIVLSNKQNSTSKFLRFKSSDSLGGLSPPCTQNKVVMLDAAEFLKCFKSDGTAAKKSLCEVSLKNDASKHVNCSVEEATSAEWPSCASFKFHDIQYHGKGRSDEFDKKGTRLKNKLINVDTCSTCTIGQAGSPASISVPSEVTTKLAKPKPTPVEPLTEAQSDNIIALRKRRSADYKQSVEETKRLYDNVKKRKKEEDDQKNELSEQESRSQRHKRKLKEVVHEVLKENKIFKADPLYKPCALRLYDLTKSFAKSLKSSKNLRQEMKSIALQNAGMVIMFEKSQLEQESQK